MAQKASAPAIYEVLTISKDGKEVALQGKTINFNYYESLYSPVITANMMFVDAGGNTPDKKENLTINQIKLVSKRINLKIRSRNMSRKN